MGRISGNKFSIGSYDEPVIMGSNDGARIVMLHGDVTEYSIAATIMQLIAYANMNNKKPITLVISTYGGSVDEMFSLYDVIKFLPCPVHTLALGKVMSAGVLLLASGKKGHRTIGSNARIMIHAISGGVGGNVLEILNQSDEIKRMQEQMTKTILAETKFTEKELSDIMNSKGDVYITPEQAVKFGIVDQIIK